MKSKINQLTKKVERLELTHQEPDPVIFQIMRRDDKTGEYVKDKRYIYDVDGHQISEDEFTRRWPEYQPGDVLQFKQRMVEP